MILHKMSPRTHHNYSWQNYWIYAYIQLSNFSIEKQYHPSILLHHSSIKLFENLQYAISWQSQKTIVYHCKLQRYFCFYTACYTISSICLPFSCWFPYTKGQYNLSNSSSLGPMEKNSLFSLNSTRSIQTPIDKDSGSKNNLRTTKTFFFQSTDLFTTTHIELTLLIWFLSYQLAVIRPTIQCTCTFFNCKNETSWDSM